MGCWELTVSQSDPVQHLNGSAMDSLPPLHSTQIKMDAGNQNTALQISFQINLASQNYLLYFTIWLQ